MEPAESDLESLSPDESDDVLGSDEDYEPKLKHAKRKPGPAVGATLSKRPRRGIGSSTTSSSLAQTPGASRTIKLPPAPQPARSSGIGVTERRKRGSMFEAVGSGRPALVTVVDDWLEVYKQDQTEGLLELLNFIVECCGCKGIVTREMFDTMQNADIISHLTQEFNEDSVVYPLSAGGFQGRRFHEGLCEFVYQLVQRCRNRLLYDEFVFSALVAFLTGLADSQVRAFRHTSTLIAMRLMSAIVAVSAMVCAQADTMQKRYELEKSKSVALRATERLEELHNSYNELLEQQEELHSLMNGIFKGVFVHRYRDKVPEIRALCMEELGAWLRENPSSFLNDGHLKYLGWMLHDKQPSVRLKCVLSLQKLYEEKSFVGRLELFTSRFKRMLNMVLDKDSDVAVEAVRLLLIIKQMTEDGLTDEECMLVYPLVFAVHRGLSSAAGEFLYHVLCSEVDHLLEEGGRESRNVTFLNLLTCFFIQSKFHEHAAYLVDSLWAVAASELRDWETMTSLLLQENGEEQGLNDEEEAALIELMMCAVRQASEGTPPTARALGRKSLKGRKQQTQDRKRITNHFIPLLPQLLTKFSADVEKVACLLKAPLHFDLEVYGSTGRLEKSFELLLSQVCEIVQKHHEERVLEACVRVLCVLCCDQYTFSARAERVVGQLLDSTLERFNTHLVDVLQGTADDDDVYSTVTSLKRLTIFSSAKDLTVLELFEPCFLLMKTGVERELETEMMSCALKCTLFHLLWTRVKISQTPQPGKAAIKNLIKRVHSFCLVCQSCLSLNCGLIRNQAFECLCDLLVVFGEGSGGDTDNQRVCFSPDDALRAEMASFLIDYIFSDPDDEDPGAEEVEQNIISLHLKRNQLAGYCKLIIYGVLELNAAAHVFIHYSKFYRDFGDIIKETLSKTKSMSPMESARTVCLSLQQLYSSLGDGDHDEDMRDTRDLAKKLAMSFGVNLQNVRQPLIALHQDGIRFALREVDAGDQPRLSFLEILSEFSHKLLKQDRAQLLKYLRSVCEKARVSTSISMRIYERSLQSGSREAPAVSPLQTPAKRRRTTERSVSSILDTPAFTSTVIQSRVAHTQQLSQSPSPEFSTDQLSEDEFAEGSIQRKVMPSRREQESSEPSDVQSQLQILSLIEEDFEEEGEPDIEDYDDEDSDGVGTFSLPSTRHSTSFLEELFE